MKGYGGTRVDAVDTGVPCVRYGDLYTYHNEFVVAAKSYLEPETAKNYFLLRKGDVVFAASGETLEEIGKSAEVLLDGEVRCGGDTIVFRPAHQFAPGFLGYALDSSRARSAKARMGRGYTVVHIYQSELRELPVPIPPFEEQCRIAAFLDYETARIDELVHEQERLLSLLDERVGARITDLVTKGLSVDAELRDSGREELGLIPTHWEARSLKYLLRDPLTYGANEAAVEDDPTQPRYIRITDVDDQGNLRDETFRSLSWEVARAYLLQDRDLLLARSGATVGKSFMYRQYLGPACFAGYMIRARFDPQKLMPEFAEAYFQSRPYWAYIKGSNIQATIQNVSAEKYANCPVPVPPLEEQAAILEKLTVELAASRELVSQAAASISYLLERRSALINAAVIGQLDLGDWQPPESRVIAEVA